MGFTKDKLVSKMDIYSDNRERIVLEKYRDKKRENSFLVSYYRPFIMVVVFVPNKGYLLVEKYAQGPQEEVLGFIGGFLEEKENPIAGALRELEEEVGITYDRVAVQLIGSCYENVARSRVPYYVVNAVVSDEIPLLLTDKNPDKLEARMKPVYVSEQQLFSREITDRMQGAITLSALVYLRQLLNDQRKYR